MFTVNQERNQAKRQILGFLREQAPGTRLSWLEIEIGSGVSMRYPGPGRDLVREVLASRRGLNQPWETLPGYGIVLSCVNNTLTIAGKSLKKVGNAIRRGARKHGQLSKYREELSPGDRVTYDTQRAFYGAVRTACKSIGSEPHSEVKVLPRVASVLPKRF